MPDLLTKTMITQTKATTKMKSSNDVIDQYTSDVFTPSNEERLVHLKLQNVYNKTRHKEDTRSSVRESE